MLLLEYQLDKTKTVDFFVMANFLDFTLFFTHPLPTFIPKTWQPNDLWSQFIYNHSSLMLKNLEWHLNWQYCLIICKVLTYINGLKTLETFQHQPLDFHIDVTVLPRTALCNKFILHFCIKCIWNVQIVKFSTKRRLPWNLDFKNHGAFIFWCKYMWS